MDSLERNVSILNDLLSSTTTSQRGIKSQWEIVRTEFINAIENSNGKEMEDFVDRLISLRYKKNARLQRDNEDKRSGRIYF